MSMSQMKKSRSSWYSSWNGTDDSSDDGRRWRQMRRSEWKRVGDSTILPLLRELSSRRELIAVWAERSVLSCIAIKTVCMCVVVPGENGSGVSAGGYGSSMLTSRSMDLSVLNTGSSQMRSSSPSSHSSHHEYVTRLCLRFANLSVFFHSVHFIR